MTIFTPNIEQIERLRVMSSVEPLEGVDPKIIELVDAYDHDMEVAEVLDIETEVSMPEGLTTTEQIMDWRKSNPTNSFEARSKWYEFLGTRWTNNLFSRFYAGVDEPIRGFERIDISSSRDGLVISDFRQQHPLGYQAVHEAVIRFETARQDSFLLYRFSDQKIVPEQKVLDYHKLHKITEWEKDVALAGTWNNLETIAIARGQTVSNLCR
jgi:hypothetical protein